MEKREQLKRTNRPERSNILHSKLFAEFDKLRDKHMFPRFPEKFNGSFSSLFEAVLKILIFCSFLQNFETIHSPKILKQYGASLKSMSQPFRQQTSASCLCVLVISRVRN